MMKPTRLLLILYSTLLAVPCLAADDGAKIVDEVCSGCHTAKTRPLDKMHLTREQWSEAVEKMIGFGADVPKAKIPALLDYLVRTQGPDGTAADADKK
jgi:mono/diheme cytochrome c family protein